ncbi:transcriptional regulator [Methylobacterium oryzae]
MAIITPVTCKAARAGLDVPVRELARRADVSTNTIVRYEGGAELRDRTIRAIQAALEAEGATFLENDDAGTGPGVRLRPRAQASSEPMQSDD